MAGLGGAATAAAATWRWRDSRGCSALMEVWWLDLTWVLVAAVCARGDLVGGGRHGKAFPVLLGAWWWRLYLSTRWAGGGSWSGGGPRQQPWWGYIGGVWWGRWSGEMGG